MERKLSDKKHPAGKKPSATTPRSTKTTTAPSTSEPSPATASDPISSADLDNIHQLQSEGKLLEAREATLQLIETGGDPALVRRAEEVAGDLNTKLTLNPLPMSEKVDYTIRRGDTLGGIAKKYKTTVELIQKSNNIKSHLIRVGDRLPHPQGSV